MPFQAYLDHIIAKTGKSPEDFKKLALKKGLLKPETKAGKIVAWLKEDFDLGHGHAMAFQMMFTTICELLYIRSPAVNRALCALMLACFFLWIRFPLC